VCVPSRHSYAVKDTRRMQIAYFEEVVGLDIHEMFSRNIF
jgi:hypothetical protein